MFRWRVPGGSLGRTLAAVVLTSGIFALVASVFHVRGRSMPPTARETAHLYYLPSNTDSGRQWWDLARQNSPFPDPWNLDTIDTLRQHMEIFEADLAQRAAYRPLLRPLESPDREFSLPQLFDPAAPPLPPVPRPVAPAGPPEPVESRVVVTASGPIEERWSGVAWTLEDLLSGREAHAEPLNARELLGSRRLFFVMVDSEGRIVFCQNLDGDERELDEVLAARLRQEKLAPASAGQPLEGGYVEVVVQGVTGNEDEEKGP